MYINGKMRPVETVPGTRERGREENGGRGEFKRDCKNL
jgi:hypothetical protein